MRAVALLLAALLAGCSDPLGLFRPDYSVAITHLTVGAAAWNRDGSFEVQVGQAGVPVRIEAVSTRGDVRTADGVSQAEVELPDGTWSIAYEVGGYDWGILDPVRIDATPPQVTALALVGQTLTGSYDLGAGASVTGADLLRILDMDTGKTWTELPVHLEGLAPGLHLYRVAARDAAGNWANATVQVRSGSGSIQELPTSRTDFGVVARYNNGVRLWDLRDLGSYLSPAAAAQAQPSYLRSGFGITPDASAVRDVVAQAAPAGGTTGEIAMALYRWMADNLEYDDARLNQSSLLTPSQTLLDNEDRDGRDRDGPDGKGDGLVDDGTGNGVKGGVCRDLAALYVSLLRSAGVPARLVTGYVAGNVDGFHAWVEFYGAPADTPSPWVPVDVSPLDGPFSDNRFLGSFGIQLPEYLMLRQLPASAEVQGWYAAGSLGYQWPQGSPQPDVRFEDFVSDDHTEAGVLCINPTSRMRFVADAGGDCPRGTSHFLQEFVLSTQRTIDYGITIKSAPPGTTVEAQVAYPFDDLSSPDLVHHGFQGLDYGLDPTTGKAKATLKR